MDHPSPTSRKRACLTESEGGSDGGHPLRAAQVRTPERETCKDKAPAEHTTLDIEGR